MRFNHIDILEKIVNNIDNLWAYELNQNNYHVDN